ncbi:hypothetical protein BT96DRAFT_430442 [Gymnopus androsaceus JB14]|uniref:F-box domain-containing protein n=1 Tax=Gymnopus androsaceus JB14 TaxID=1447944 RepID=A0A6A4GSD0_9AGAR|nr:hypothetical protein BT96DRAFT_430442 [Gymnopus androsaceus JB14]
MHNHDDMYRFDRRLLHYQISALHVPNKKRALRLSMATAALPPLLTLPVELRGKIQQNLQTRDRIALVSTCSTLYHNADLGVWYDGLCELKKKHTVLCLPSETPDMEAYQPFIIVDIVRDSEANIMTLVVYCPFFFPNNDREPFIGDINVKANDLWVETTEKEEEYPWNNCSDGELYKLDWHTQVQGKIQLMTGSLLRKVWGHQCPECGGERSICPGCGGVSARWSELRYTDCGWNMPCPSCMGYDLAYDAKNLQRHGDDALEEMWKELDALDSPWLEKSTSRMKKCVSYST